MHAPIHSIFRHPVKGLSPEPLTAIELTKGEYFPLDRLYAVEVGPSGFDPEHPRHISKQRFTVLARFPQLAKLHTRFDETGQRLNVSDETGFGVDIPFDQPASRDKLAKFLQAFLGDETDQTLNVLEGPGSHRFMDNNQDGFVSAINLASIRAVEEKIGKFIDPARFRANIYYDAGEPWIEDRFQRLDRFTAGGTILQLRKPIVRCIATHVDPITATRDIDMVGELTAHFGRNTLGNYFAVVKSGRVAIGDTIASQA